MYPGGVQRSGLAYVPEKAFPMIQRYRIYSDDIFISVAGTLGIVGVVPPELSGANLTENADRITDLKCDRDYLKYWLMSQPIQDSISAIATIGAQPKLALERISAFVVVLPRDSAEQHAIAAVLSDVDELIGSLEGLIAKKRAIKQAAMQLLLTGRKRLPGFGGKWEMRRLGDLGTFCKGRGIRRDELGEAGVRCVRYGELYTRYENYVAEPVSRIPQHVAETALPIAKGDLLFAGSGETADEIGTCVAYVGDEPAHAGGDIIVLRAPRQDAIYLAHLLNSPVAARQKARMAQGDAIVHIRGDHLAEVEIPLPPLPEQQAIATILSDMDAEIAALERRLDKTRAIKQGMMQQLLTRFRPAAYPRCRHGRRPRA